MSNPKHLSKTGRILYAVPFLIFGAFHLLGAQQMATLVPGFFTSILPGSVWVIVTGLVFIAAAAGILFKKYTKYASLLIAFQLLVFILTVWLPQLGDEATSQIAMVNLLKDLALLGGALMIAGKGDCKCGCGSTNCEHCEDCKNCRIDGGSSESHDHENKA